MNRYLTGLALVLMLTGCSSYWTAADVHTANTYCAKHGGLRSLTTDVARIVECNNGISMTVSDAYKDVYKSNYP